MQLTKPLGVAALLLGPAAAGPVQRRGTVGSEDIVGLPETVPDNTDGTLYLTYKPFLYRVDGCDPYPAVDAEGNTKYVFPPVLLSGQSWRGFKLLPRVPEIF
jgi:hypothetical protein